MTIGKLVRIIPRYMQKICMDYMPQRNKGDLNRTHIRVLVAIGYSPGISIKKLAELIMIDLGALSRIIKEFDDNGFIIKKVDEADRRVSVLHLSKDGTKIFIENMNKYENYIEDLFVDFSEEEKEEFIGALNILYKYIDRI